MFFVNRSSSEKGVSETDKDTPNNSDVKSAISERLSGNNFLSDVPTHGIKGLLAGRRS